MVSIDKKPLVMISWDGVGEQLPFLQIDAEPDFNILIVDYSGKNSDLPVFVVKGLKVTLLSRWTECKGDLFNVVADYLQDAENTPEYIGLIDDDIVISVSQINKLLHLGKIKKLDVFSPVLTHDSEYSHGWMLQQTKSAVRLVPWVEVMIPFYKYEVFVAGAPFYKNFVSSWGFDKYLFPMIQKITNLDRCGLIDAVAVSHFRPITSQLKKYRNGFTAAEEMDEMRNVCISHIQLNYRELVDTVWFNRIYKQKKFYNRFWRNLYKLGRPIRIWLERST